MYRTDKIEVIENGSEKILVNLISGGILQVSNDEYERFISNDISANEQQKYFAKKMLFMNAEDEQEYMDKIREVIDKKELAEAPNFTIMLTFACNLNCGYCFEKVTMGKTERLLEDNIRKICSFIDKKIDKNNSQYSRVALTGGEPLLIANRKYVKEILEYTKTRNLKLHIVTNGTTLLEYAEMLKDYEIDFIQVTIDGPEEIHNQRRKAAKNINCYKTIMKGIDECKKYNIPVIIRLNADRENIKKIKNLDNELFNRFNNSNVKGYVYLMKDEGCMDDSICIEEEKAVDFLLEKNLKFFDLAYHGKHFIKRTLGLGDGIPMLRFCTAAKNQYVLCPDGKVYKCWFGAGDKRFSIGNYIDNNIDSEMENEWHERNISRIEECKTCKYGFICGGGCANRALKNNNSIMTGNCANFSELLRLGYTKEFCIGGMENVL